MRVTVAIGCILAATVLCSAAGAQQPTDATKNPPAAGMDEARERFQRGLKLYNDANYEGARVEFERAYQLAPSYKLLYNIGYCYNKLNDYVAAVRALEQYLKEGGTEIPEDRRGEVVQALYEIRPRLGSVEVTTNTEGATIAVDDVPVATSPVKEAVLLNPGRRKITAAKKGWTQATQMVTVAGKEKLKVTLELEPAKTTTTVVVTEGKVPIVAPVVLWTLTGAVTVVAVITGVLAVNAKGKQNDLLAAVGMGDPAAHQKALADARSQTNTFGVVTDILIPTAIAAAGVATFITIRALTGKSKEAPAPATAQGFSMRVGLAGPQAVVTGEF